MPWTPAGMRRVEPLPGFARNFGSVKGLEWNESHGAIDAVLSLHPLRVEIVAGLLAARDGSRSYQFHAACVLPLYGSMRMRVFPSGPWWNQDVRVLFGLVKDYTTGSGALDDHFIVSGAPADTVLHVAREARLERLVTNSDFDIQLRLSRWRTGYHWLHLKASYPEPSWNVSLRELVPVLDAFCDTARVLMSVDAHTVPRSERIPRLYRRLDSQPVTRDHAGLSFHNAAFRAWLIQEMEEGDALKQALEHELRNRNPDWHAAQAALYQLAERSSRDVLPLAARLLGLCFLEHESQWTETTRGTVAAVRTALKRVGQTAHYHDFVQVFRGQLRDDVAERLEQLPGVAAIAHAIAMSAASLEYRHHAAVLLAKLGVVDALPVVREIHREWVAVRDNTEAIEEALATLVRLDRLPRTAEPDTDQENLPHAAGPPSGRDDLPKVP